MIDDPDMVTFILPPSPSYLCSTQPRCACWVA